MILESYRSREHSFLSTRGAPGLGRQVLMQNLNEMCDFQTTIIAHHQKTLAKANLFLL